MKAILVDDAAVILFKAGKINRVTISWSRRNYINDK